MTKYQVIARKYRPKLFREIVGQDAIITTLKNAIRRNKLAHAYLFCGARGTGKTTLARVFAKALNCQAPSDDGEPCNQCPSCKEITQGCSLDVLEIDGASHRGIDDVRQINETVGYAAAYGKFKIYIIDEVHMLTKEAFNALLKTLEEPPPNVKFFFATTEPHKVLPTILSRCQRFNLNRIPTDAIQHKLQQIALDLNVEIQEEALRLLAQRADGGLRDAESLLDQIIAFHDSTISVEDVYNLLGMVPHDCLFALDQAGKEGNLAVAFEIAHNIFSQGKDMGHFIESLQEHFRTILLFKLAPQLASSTLSEGVLKQYESSAKIYGQEQCLNILEYLLDVQVHNRFSLSGRVTLEGILLHILRTHQRVSVEVLVKKLADLEQRLAGGGVPVPEAMRKPPVSTGEVISPKSEAAQLQVSTSENSAVVSSKPEAMRKPPVSIRENSAVLPPKPQPQTSMTEDPTPTPADLGVKPTMPVELGARLTDEAKASLSKQQSKFDTLLQFASVELEGTIQKKQRG